MFELAQKLTDYCEFENIPFPNPNRDAHRKLVNQRYTCLVQDWSTINETLAVNDTTHVV